MAFLDIPEPVTYAFFAALFTWGVTALGASLVFFFKKINIRILNLMLGFASGVMLAASYWSLLEPAIEISRSGPVPPFIVAASGFLLGAGFLWASDKALTHLQRASNRELDYNTKHKCALLVFSITIHNIPEGAAVGVAFAAAAESGDPAAFMSAVAIAVGIGLQNFPEGAAVSIPLRRAGLTRSRSFFYGQASGMVEPVAAVIGAAVVSVVQPILPYALAFAAGAMVYVVIDELVPEAHCSNPSSSDLAVIGCMIGFVIMMVLDVALG